VDRRQALDQLGVRPGRHPEHEERGPGAQPVEQRQQSLGLSPEGFARPLPAAESKPATSELMLAAADCGASAKMPGVADISSANAWGATMRPRSGGPAGAADIFRRPRCLFTQALTQEAASNAAKPDG